MLGPLLMSVAFVIAGFFCMSKTRRAVDLATVRRWRQITVVVLAFFTLGTLGLIVYQNFAGTCV